MGIKTTYHLVEISSWPLKLGIIIPLGPLGLIYYIKNRSLTFLIIFFFTIIFSIMLWFRDIIREGSIYGFHTKKVNTGLKYGMLLFIVSEVIFFFSFFWAYFHSRLSPNIEIGGVWPPIGISVINYIGVPLINTSVLLLRGVSVTWSHHAIQNNIYKSSYVSLLITIILGLYFLYLQKIEYSDSSFSIADSTYGRCFFIATGFHGLHVTIGAIILSIILYLFMIFKINRNTHKGFLFAAWYWHFVDVVWLFLFISIYWWGPVERPEGEAELFLSLIRENFLLILHLIN